MMIEPSQNHRIAWIGRGLKKHDHHSPATRWEGGQEPGALEMPISLFSHSLTEDLGTYLLGEAVAVQRRAED